MSSAPNSTLPRLFLRPCEFGVLRNGLVKDCKHQECARALTLHHTRVRDC